MKNPKALFLSLALALPIAVFVFLKLFGRNQFDIPVYFPSGVDSVCVDNKSKPYAVPDTVLNAIDWNNAPLLVTYLPSEAEVDNFKHVWEEIDKTQISSVFLSSNLTQWRDCALLIREPWKTVLIDDKKHIRGYYNLATREETDRLIVELKILLKKY